MVTGFKILELEAERRVLLLHCCVGGIWYDTITIKTQYLSGIDCRLGKETDDVKFATYRYAAKSPSVTQAEVAVKEVVSVLALGREQQGGEASLQGQAALGHYHLASVSGTPGRGDGEGHWTSLHN